MFKIAIALGATSVVNGLQLQAKTKKQLSDELKNDILVSIAGRFISSEYNTQISVEASGSTTFSAVSSGSIVIDDDCETFNLFVGQKWTGWILDLKISTSDELTWTWGKELNPVKGPIVWSRVFQPATTFLGKKPGFVFMTGEQGMGYYMDMALQQRSAAVATKDNNLRNVDDVAQGRKTIEAMIAKKQEELAVRENLVKSLEAEIQKMKDVIDDPRGCIGKSRITKRKEKKQKELEALLNPKPQEIKQLNGESEEKHSSQTWKSKILKFKTSVFSACTRGLKNLGLTKFFKPRVQVEEVRAASKTPLNHDF